MPLIENKTKNKLGGVANVVEIGEELDIFRQAQIADTIISERSSKKDHKPHQFDISELCHLRGEYKGKDEVLKKLDDLTTHTFEVKKIISRTGEKVILLLYYFLLLGDL